MGSERLSHEALEELREVGLFGIYGEILVTVVWWRDVSGSLTTGAICGPNKKRSFHLRAQR